MIQIQDDARKIRMGGQVLETAHYHIDEAAVPHISAMLRNMYSEPILAVVREYLSNAVDAHVQTGCLDRAIAVHLPTVLEPYFAVRDFGGGLDRDSTEKLLYGYGASGEHKRTSNDQIGGFGIGCKCGFAVAEAFTYTIWHGGKKAVWNCFLDERDVGKANLVSDTPSDEPAGIEVRIPMAISDWSTKRQVQRALESVVPFLKVPVKLTHGAGEYTLPERPKPLLQMDAVCSIDGKDSEIKFSFYSGAGVMRSVSGPAIMVGSTLYEVNRDQAKDAFEKLDAKRNTVAKLMQSLVIHVPIGMVQLAPSRESLQYSAWTRGVLKRLFDTFASDEFQKALMKKLSEEMAGLSLRDQWNRYQLTGVRGTAPLMTELGLGLPRTAVSAFWMATIQGLQPGPGYIQNLDTMRAADISALHDRFCCWIPNSWLEHRANDDRPLVAFKLPPGTGEPGRGEPEREWILRVASEAVRRHPTASSLSVLVLNNADESKITWLTDGSVELLDKVPDTYDTAKLRLSTSNGAGSAAVRRRRQATRSAPTHQLGTKFLKMRTSSRDGHEGHGAWWDKITSKELKELPKPLVYVKLDAMAVTFQDEDGYSMGRMYLEPGRVKACLFSQVTPSLFPELASLYGIRVKDAEAVKGNPDFLELREYLGMKFTEHIKTGQLNPERLLMDLAWGCIKHEGFLQCSQIVDSVAEVFKHVKPGTSAPVDALMALVKRSQTMDEKAKPTEAVWANLLMNMEKLGLCQKDINSSNEPGMKGGLRALQTLKGKNQLFDIPAKRGELFCCWWSAHRDVNTTTWVALKRFNSPNENPLEGILRRVCDDYPLLATAANIPSIWLPRVRDYILEGTRNKLPLRYRYAQADLAKAISEWLEHDPGVRKRLCARVGAKADTETQK